MSADDARAAFEDARARRLSDKGGAVGELDHKVRVAGIRAPEQRAAAPPRSAAQPALGAGDTSVDAAHVPQHK